MTLRYGNLDWMRRGGKGGCEGYVHHFKIQLAPLREVLIMFLRLISCAYGGAINLNLQDENDIVTKFRSFLEPVVLGD